MQTKTHKYGHVTLTAAGLVNRALHLGEVDYSPENHWWQTSTISDHMNDALDLLGS